MATTLSVATLFHNLLPTDLDHEASLSVAHCVNTCFYNRTCASMFYDHSRKLCYQSDLWFDKAVAGLNPQPSVSYITFIRSDCPENWIYHKPTGKCFYSSTEKVTNAAAIAFCELHGGRLFNVYSAEEDKIPLTLTVRSQSGHWIGMLWDGENWYWHKGSEVGYTNWKDDIGTRTCARYSVEALKWRTSNCEGDKLNLCEVVLSANYCST